MMTVATRDTFAQIVMSVDPEEMAHLSDDQRRSIAGDIAAAEADIRVQASAEYPDVVEKRKMAMIKGGLELRKRLARRVRA